MIPNSDNQAAVAVITPPDWARGVQLSQMHQTAQHMSRNGYEQRRRMRRTPKYRLAYEVTGLSNEQAKAAALNARAESRAVCIVPFWTERAQTIAPISGNVVTIDSDPRRDFFAAGHYVYFFTDDLGGQFRRITTVVGRILTLEAAVGAITYGTGAKVYPARKCRRIIGQDDIRAPDWTSRETSLLYETTGD